jgi:hypothetical protein
MNMSDQTTQAKAPPAIPTGVVNAAPSKKSWIKYGAIGCAGVFGFCVVVGVLGAIFGDDDGDTEDSDASVAEATATAEPTAKLEYSPTPGPDADANSRTHRST